MLAWGTEREVERVNPKAAETRPDLTTRTLEDVEAAIERQPAVRLSTGELLHVYQDDEGWWVWLNTEVSEFDGLCVGAGTTRDGAVAAAVQVFEAAIAELQHPAA